MEDAAIMAKRRRKSTAKRPRITHPAHFAVGDMVRVRRGVVDPDFPDIPLGGWAGVVQEISRRGPSHTYLIAWNDRTLEQMHPVHQHRCERDELDAESMWLADSDLEPDTGEPAPIEQPTQLITRPLRTSNREDRIRMVFGLSSDDPMPEVSRETLRRYHAYLAERLTFPFPATCVLIEGESIPDIREHRFQVTSLVDSSEADPKLGLMCEATEDGETRDMPLMILTVPPRHANRVLLGDYAYWVENWPADGDELEDEDSFDEPVYVPVRLRPGVTALRTLAYAVAGAIYGAILGAAVGAVAQAGLAAQVGAAVLGLLGLLVGMAPNRSAGRSAMGRVHNAMLAIAVAALVGGLVATVLVVLVAAYPGALIGGFAGALFGGLAARGRTPTMWSLVGACTAGTIGAYGLAVARDPAEALTGALYGAGIGAVGGACLYLVEVGMLLLAATREH